MRKAPRGQRAKIRTLKRACVGKAESMCEEGGSNMPDSMCEEGSNMPIEQVGERHLEAGGQKLNLAICQGSRGEEGREHV